MAKIIFPIIASLLPVWISDLLREELGRSSTLILVLAAVVSFVLLVLTQFLLETVGRRFDGKNKYCGQWVEEMTRYTGDPGGENSPAERMIGIGIIRYDRQTGEYVFDGNTYRLDGAHVYHWTIDYLHLSRDVSMQYICSVQIPGQRSIGQITFSSKDECTGTIWIMDGEWYKFDGHRIQLTELYQAGVNPLSRPKLRLFLRQAAMTQQDTAKFVRNYSRDHLQPMESEQPAGQQPQV